MKKSTHQITPEVLAPVGNWDMCMAAVHNGADAIYVGMPGFNARARSYDHSFEELEKIINYCHLHSVQVYVAFNILIFQSELELAREALAKLLPLGPDALIVQDIGLARLVKQMCPEQVVHASTQMTITSSEAIRFVEDLDMKRYVLGREISIDEMKQIRSTTDKELEVFVHGALCVAYSGQCLTSESMGGRSANRGQCAQSCRLDYKLLVDGKEKPLQGRDYLVSPKDLCGVSKVNELYDIGINSLKIEGRYKPPGYVATAARSYKNAILEAKQSGSSYSNDSAIDDMKINFSRDFFTGWLDGVDHNNLVDGRFSNHRGLKIGKIIRVIAKAKFPTIEIESKREIFKGDGLQITNKLEKFLVGGKVFDVQKTQNSTYKISFDKSFKLHELVSGLNVYMNSSANLDKETQSSWKDKQKLKRIPINIKAKVSKEHIYVCAQDDKNNVVEVNFNENFEEAKSNPLNEQTLKKALSSLSATAFELNKFECTIADKLFIPNKTLKTIRRELTDKLTQKRTSSPQHKIQTQESTLQWIQSDATSITKTGNLSAKLNILIREENQLEALTGLDIDTIYLDYKHGKTYNKSVDKIREMGFKAGIVTTRIYKAGKTRFLDILDRISPDVVLVRNLGAFQYFKDKYGNECPYELVGDFSLNATNSLTASYMLSKGLDRICPSYDLNKVQLNQLLDHVPGESTEITIHQYMPSFHMEHCVFATFLTNGSSIKDCGMICRKHEVEMVDVKGISHPLQADQECRNTMFNGVAQSAVEIIPTLKDKGVNNFRFEALKESPSELREKISSYIQLLNEEISTNDLISKFNLLEKYGVSEGQLQNTKKYQDRKKPQNSPI